MKHPLITTLIMAALLTACGGGGDDTPANSLNAPTNTDAIDDDDKDGISASDEETIHYSDPNDPHDPVPYGHFDHDNDGTPNGADSDYDGTDDSDNDGLSNKWEYSQNLNPSQAEILVTQELLFRW